MTRFNMFTEGRKLMEIKNFKKMPKSCDVCPLFVSEFGKTAYCVMGAEYSDKEIAKEKDGNLSMYYHGCLSKRPISCPLKEDK